jgi:hypothetical protein
MLHLETKTNKYRVDIWEEASPGTNRASQDTSLLIPFDRFLRVAAIDGISPHPDGPITLGCDSGIYGAGVVSLALKSGLSLVEAFGRANKELYKEGANIWMTPRATVIALDIAVDGSAEAVRGGDCLLFIKRSDKWISLLPDLKTPKERRESIRSRLESQGKETINEVMKNLAASSDTTQYQEQSSCAIGTLKEANLEVINIEEGWQEIILCSDGARFSEEACDDSEGWINGLREWERSGGDGTVEPWKPHDDVTLIRIRAL